MPLSCKSGNISICAIEYDAAQWDELRSLNAADDHLRIGCCDSQVTLITSKLGTRFFAHRRRGACTSAPETAEHLLVKEIIARAIAGTGWTVATEVRGNTPDGGLWTADVLAERGKHRIAFEVQWSPQNQEETAQRQERYRNSGVRGLWLMSRPSGLQISKEVPSLLVQVDLDTRTANIKIPAMESMGLTDHSARNADFLWSQKIELGRFVRGCLSRKFIWAPGLNDRVPLEISSVKQDCWKCHKPTSIITSLEFRVDLVVPGAKPIALGLADFDTPEGLPILAQALEQTDLRKYGIGDIRRRYSRTRGMAYLSNGCVHCDALQGAFFEHDIGHDAEPTLTIQCDMPEALFNESTHGARMMWALTRALNLTRRGSIRVAFWSPESAPNEVQQRLIGSPSTMWYESLPSDWSWESLWYGYTRCSCGGIRNGSDVCSACNEPLSSPAEMFARGPNGQQFPIAHSAPGGEGRYEDYIYLRMLEREWLRPLSDEDRFLGIVERHRPSARAIVVLTFWTYFETKIDRLYRTAGRQLPERVLEDFMRRHSSIGVRLDRAYRVFFGTNYLDDLKDQGFSDTAELLQRVHKCRNQFAHGQPEAIDDHLVKSLVAGLQREHQAWISVFNKRVNHLDARDA